MYNVYDLNVRLSKDPNFPASFPKCRNFSMFSQMLWAPVTLICNNLQLINIYIEQGCQIDMLLSIINGTIV